MQMSLSRTVKRVNNPGVIIEVMSLGLSQQGHIYICLPSFFKMQISKRATLTDSPFFKWAPAGYPMRDWHSSNVRGTRMRHTRATLKEDKEALPVPAQMHNRLSHKR